MKEEITYSIITPVYNREDCILRCLNSSMSQEYKGWEHIVVNDGSTDGTFKIVNACVQTNDRIRLLQMGKNKGTNAARNRAIQNAKGKFIIILDSDDYLFENALQVINDSITIHPGYLHYLFAQDDMFSIYQSNNLLKEKERELSFENWVKSEVGGDFVHVIDREMLCRFPFDETLRIYEDLNFMLIYKYSQKQQFINIIVVHRERNRLDSVTKETTLINSNAIQSQFEYLKQMIMNFEDDYRQYNLVKLNCMIRRCLIFSLALSDYGYYGYLSNKFNERNALAQIIFRLKLGRLLKYLIMVYSWIKHL